MGMNISPTINVRNSALCNLLCVYFSIGNPQAGKKNKQNNNLLIIKNFSKSQTHHKQQLQKHWTLLRLFFIKIFILRRFVFKSIWAENYKNHRKKNTDRMEYILSFSCLSFCSYMRFRKFSNNKTFSLNIRDNFF